MANKLILKKSSVAAKVPLATDLEVGELAVNLIDKKLYSKNAAGTVVNVGNVVDSVAGKTGVVTLVKGDVGLGSVDNTSDASKPVSTAQQTALNLKANLASPTFTGTPAAPTAAVGTNTTQLATTAYVNAEIANDAPTKTGGGASGSWAISVTGSSASTTGNAATATTLQTARTINNVSFNGSANVVVPSIWDADFKRITNPVGGVYTTSTSTVTGAITVVLPLGFTNTMNRMSVKIYEYTTNESFEVYFGGYNYSTGSWINPFAYILGNPTVDRRFTVRFGKNSAGNAVVYIGELASTWSYPQVFITEAQLGYSGMSSSWTSNWSIAFTTAAFENVTATITNAQIGYATAINVANAIPLRDASGNFSAGTITAALNGNAATATLAANSTLAGGLAINTTGTNNLANQIMRTNSSGYANFGWINTTSGATTSTIARIYASQDGYIRYVTPATFRTQITDGYYANAGAGGAIVENSQTISANYTLTAGKNGMSAGNITINSGVTVTIPSGANWVIV